MLEHLRPKHEAPLLIVLRSDGSSVGKFAKRRLSISHDPGIKPNVDKAKCVVSGTWLQRIGSDGLERGNGSVRYCGWRQRSGVRQCHGSRARPILAPATRTLWNESRTGHFARDRIRSIHTLATLGKSPSCPYSSNTVHFPSETRNRRTCPRASLGAGMPWGLVSGPGKERQPSWTPSSSSW